MSDSQEVHEAYQRQKANKGQCAFPALVQIMAGRPGHGADFIHQHPELVQDKNVLELAAGLGLPSLVAARYAKSICGGDYLEEAVATMARSAQHLQLSDLSYWIGTTCPMISLPMYCCSAISTTIPPV